MVDEFQFEFIREIPATECYEYSIEQADIANIYKKISERDLISIENGDCYI